MAGKKSTRVRLHEEDRAVLDEIKQMTTSSARDLQRIKRGTEIANANLDHHNRRLRQILKETKRNQKYMKRSTEVLNGKLNAQEKRLRDVKNTIQQAKKSNDKTLSEISQGLKENKEFMTNRTERMLEKLEKIEKETDPSGKVIGIFDFTFGIITITFAILFFSIKSDDTSKLDYIIGARACGLFFTILGLLIFWFLAFRLIDSKKLEERDSKLKRLKYKLRELSFKRDIGIYTWTQIILSTCALLIYMVIANVV